MNDSNLLQLKILVERAVRPVRASVSRKQNMREELLSHVCSVFEEESSRLGDQQAALAQTAQRFGNPVEVTQSLQTSLPRHDRLDLFVDELWLRPGESTLRRAVRHTLVAGTWLVFFVGLILTAITVRWVRAGMRPEEWPVASVLNFSVWAFVACVVLVAGGTVLAERIRLGLNKSRQTAMSLVLPVVGGPLLIDTIASLGIVMGVVDNFWVHFDKVLWLCTFGLATTGILFFIALANSRRISQAEVWDSLPIEA